MGAFPFYVTAWRMAFRRNLQYRGQHMVNNVASAVFGFIYIALWQAVMSGRAQSGRFTVESLAHYIAVCQCLLWITTFDRSGIQIARRVRDGSIASDLLRPVGFAWLQLSQILGQKAYNLVFRSLVLGLVFWVTVGFGLPEGWAARGLSAAAWVLAGYTGALITYLVGLAGFWTTEPTWMYLLTQSLTLILGGASIPLDLLPEAVVGIAKASPFACLAYHPAAIYLGWSGARALVPMLAWPVVLTAVALYLTVAARRRLEVVGG